MKQKLRIQALSYAAAVLTGLAALWLQTRSLQGGYDGKGLFLWNNPAQLALAVLCAAAAAGLIALTLGRVAEQGSYAQLFPRNWLRGAMAVLAAVMLGLDLLYSLDPVPMALRVLGLAAAVGMAFGGVCAAGGCRPHPAFHAAVCVYLLVRLLASYRVWSSSAHLERYAMPMLAGVLLMLYAFHRCSADAERIARRKMILTGFGGVLCSLTALADPGDRVFFLASVIWVLGSMCYVGPIRKRPGKAV